MSALACAFAPAWVGAQVAGAPFTCDVVFYQMRNTAPNSLPVKFAAVSATITPTAVYTAVKGTLINSMGYNPVDNYMYGLRHYTGAPQLYRIGQTGYELVGTIATAPGGAALGGFTPTGGVFDAAGRYYFVGQGGGNIVPSGIFRVDSIPLTGAVSVAHQYTITSTITNFGDFDFNGAGSPNGLLLGAVNRSLYRINLQQGATAITGTASVAAVSLTTANVGSVGSAFYDAFTSRFYVFDNTGNQFWQITNPQIGIPDGVATPAATYVGPPAFAGPYTPTDGTSCPISGSRVADLAITKTDGQGSAPNNSVISYNITVVNGGPYPANYSVVSDPPVPGLRKLSVTCSAPGGPPSAVCPPTLSTATFEVGVPILTFPPGTTLVFTLNALVSTTVSVNNTATIAPGPDTTDPNPSNNTATDTNVITATNTSVITAAAICPAGTLETYVNLVSNGDFAAAAPFASDLAPGALNTYGAPNFVARQSGAQSYPANAVQQNPFPGDASRSIPGGPSWLLSNGKNGAATYRIWHQVVTGLIAGRRYEFMAYVSNAVNPGTTGTMATPLPVISLAVKTSTTVTVTYPSFSPATETLAIGDRWTLVQGTFTAPTSGSVTLSISNLSGASTPDPAADVAGIAQATLRACSPAADVTVAKTNGATTVTSTGTTAYTITVSNISAITATDTLIVDPAASGLVKTSITCVVSGTNLCPATLSIPGFESPGLTIPRVVAGGTVVFRVTANVTGPPGTTVSNVVSVSGVGYTDANPNNNTATDTDNVIGLADLSVTKTNSPTTTVTAGGTTSYTITVSNAGPANVVNAVLTDAPSAGLSSCSVTCTATVGATSCPAPASVTMANLISPGITLPLMSSPSSIVFGVVCNVTATGV